MVSLAATVLSRILPNNREALAYARERLTPEHFPDKSIEKTFFRLIDTYAERYADLISETHLKDLLSRNNIDAANIILYTETFETYCNTKISEAEFHYAVDSLIDDRARQLTGTALVTSLDILERGVVVDGITLKGHDAAREFFNKQSAEIEEQVVVEEAPEGDIREESDKFLEEYEKRANEGLTSGVLSGIESIDNATGGLQKGEVCLVAAFTNAGKTQMVSQWAWHASVVQGKNVFFATTETVRDQVWRRIVARHSRQSKFGIPRGLNVKDIKDGTLDKDQLDVLRAVLTDLESPDYGKIFISQIPRRGTLSFLENRMLRQQQKWNIDFAIMDYLPLLTPEVRRSNEREEFNDILRNTKTFAVSFNHGKGVPFVSPWQISRPAMEKGVQLGAYTLGALADTSEAEKIADLIVSLLRMTPTDAEAVLQILKARDAETLPPTPVHLDYRNAYLGGTPSFADEGGSFGGFDTSTVGLL